MERLRSQWKPLLAITVLAAVGIQLFDADYNKLQTASDAAAFRHVLVHPGRSVAAAACDIVFAAGYGVLGVVLLRAVGGRIAARVGVVLIALGALFDELENVLLINNIVRRHTLTDGWIDAMRVPGTLKWIGTPAFLLLFALLISAARHRSS